MRIYCVVPILNGNIVNLLQNWGPYHISKDHLNLVCLFIGSKKRHPNKVYAFLFVCLSVWFPRKSLRKREKWQQRRDKWSVATPSRPGTSSSRRAMKTRNWFVTFLPFFFFFQFIINFIFLFGLYMFWIWLLFGVLGDWGCIYFGFWLMGLVWFGLFLSDLISLIWIIVDGICVGNLVLVGPFI